MVLGPLQDWTHGLKAKFQKRTEGPQGRNHDHRSSEPRPTFRGCKDEGQVADSRIVNDLRGALLFELLAIVLNPLIAAKAIGLAFQVGTDGHSAVVYLSNPSNEGVAAWLLFGVLVTIPVIARTWKLIGSAGANDVASLKRLNPGGWGVIALFSSGLIQGILLLGPAAGSASSARRLSDS